MRAPLREARRQQEPPHRREYVSDEPRRKSPQDDNDRMIEQDRDRTPRHRDHEPDERQWRARAGESEQRSRHRNRKDRFRDREADESQPQFVPAGDASYERHRDRRERPRQWEAGDEPEWRPRDQDREFQRPDAPPRRYRDRGFDDDQSLNSPPDDLQRRWEAGAAWRAPAREEQPHRDESLMDRERVHYAAQQEQRRRAEELEQRRFAEAEEQRRRAEELEQRRFAEAEEQRRRAEEQEQRRRAEEQEQRRRAEEQEQRRRAEEQEQRRRAEEQEQTRRLRDEQVRAERQRREREIFERAAASAAAEQRRQSSIDQAVAEIAARQQALDQERAVESARESARSWHLDAQRATAPVISESPQAVRQPEPEIRRTVAPARPAEPERVFAPWPEGWRSHGTAEAAHAAPEPPRTPSEAPRAAPDSSRAAPEPSIDISGLQEQLREMTARIEALRPSNELENAIVGLRADLAEVSRSFTEALPRRALESLEIEVKALGQRIDRSRQAGADSTALAGVEHGLAEVREALRGLMPAEGLAGFDGALKAIASKVDAIGAKDDPAALQQLEAAMEVLRSMISRVASDEALTKVAEDVRTLSAKVDHVAGGGSNVPTLAALENRIDILAGALNASTEAGHAVPRELEKLLSGLVEKLEWVQLTHTDRTALGHLEDRIAALVKRLDASDSRLGLLEGVERGLADLLVYIEQLRGANNAGAAIPAAQPSLAAAPVERADTAIKQTERSKQADRLKPTEQFGIISVHDDLFEEPQGTTDTAAEHSPSIAPEHISERSNAAFAPAPPPPLPAQGAASVPQPLFGRYEEHLQTDVASTDVIAAESTLRPSQIDAALGRPAAARTPIDPSLPPDHPLEPGSTSRSRAPSPSAERVAPAEAASESKPPVIPDPGTGKPDFIAAARRAAQAASASSAEGKNAAKSGARQPKKLTERLRTLAVAAAVVVIVVGGFHIISRLFEDGSGSSTRIDMPSGAPPSQTEPPRTQSAPPQAQPDAPARKEPPHVEAEPQPPLNAANLLAPIPLPGEQPSQKSAEPAASAGSIFSSVPAPGRRDGQAENRPPEAAPPGAGAPMDITGSLPSPPPAAAAPAPHAAPGSPAAAERLPAAIGGSTLRLAAIAGDPLAAYEIGVRFSEGRGVPASNEEAARWFEIAAKRASYLPNSGSEPCTKKGWA
jgi:localization factor PodJL